MTGSPTQTVLGGRYALEELIGRGGMADVHRAYDSVLDRPVAVKVLRDVTAEPRARERFTAEARTLARLDHPGLVTLLDVGTEGDHPYLVMELVEHVTLASCCAGQALEPVRVAALGAQVADSLAYVHGEGVVHRDIKPGNIMLTDAGRCLLTDFGIAKLLGEVAAGHTATGFTLGTAAYLSPEQVRGETLTSATDVYSLGLVLLEALTGKRAYDGAPTQAALARLTGPPTMPTDLPADWADLLHRMTALDPADRPSARDAQAALRLLAGEVTVADATAALRTANTRPLAVPIERRAKRQLYLVAAALAVLLVVVVLVGALSGGGGAGSDTNGGTNQGPTQLEQDMQDLQDAVNGS
ncbi:MAG: eukaryotic-like serine/threonine-protein kinase [Actinomycetota bacterium]|nr:eukaryotic-like serine/threonine-protein kinase [Actinomycetota bacterium]